MEKRIKIVWILSLISALVLIGVQGYWLFTQYQYVIDSHTEAIARTIQAVGEEELTQRKEESGGTFSYSLTSEMANDASDQSPRKKTTMAFTSGKRKPSWEDSTFIHHGTDLLRDSVMKVIKAMSPEELRELGNVRIDLQHENIKFQDPNEVPQGKMKQKWLNLLFSAKLPEDSVIWGMNRAMVNQTNEFRVSLMDSLLQEKSPDIHFTFSPWEPADTVMAESAWKRTGTLFSPRITYDYAYSPFQQLGISIEAALPSLPIFHKMAAQLVLAFGLVLLLIGCLVFQIKTILKQHKVGEMRQHFVNTMIHELKRPVQTLKTFVAFLGDKEMRSDEGMTQQIVQDSMFELDNLSAYLNKLRDMIKADQEVTPLHISRFDLQELIRKVIRLTHIPAGKAVRLDTRFEMESPWVEADPIHVANILSNLIENAIKYSGEQVDITIEARRKANELVLTVSDNGIGIPSVEQDKVFAKFYRGSNMPDITLPGLGLGLSYVKLISEAHQGSVALQSRLGEGTSITLYLPQ